jgi:hypothetical protein
VAAGSQNVRLFQRVAQQRFEDAWLLYTKLDKDLSVVYLAGYGVECILKALLLSAVPRAREREILSRFRGTAGHDLDRLRQWYREEGGAAVPRDLVRDFDRVNFWSVDLQYRPGRMKRRDVQAFFASARSIMDWAEGRL